MTPTSLADFIVLETLTTVKRLGFVCLLVIDALQAVFGNNIFRDGNNV
jgi:hypothetical protein